MEQLGPFRWMNWRGEEMNKPPCVYWKGRKLNSLWGLVGCPPGHPCHNPALSPSPWLCPSTNVTLPLSQAQAWFRFPGSLRALQREARLGFELWRLKTWSLPLPHYNSFGWVQQFLAPMPGALSLLRSPGHKETGSRSLTRILLRELQRGELGLTLPDTRVLSLILSRDNLMTNTGTKWKVGLGLCFCSFPGQAPPSLNTLFSLTFAFLSTQLPTCRGCMSKYIFPFASPEKWYSDQVNNN